MEIANRTANASARRMGSPHSGLGTCPAAGRGTLVGEGTIRIDGKAFDISHPGGALQRRAGPLRAAVVVAHPGHELRVHGFLCAFRPLLLVLTDGSGRGGASRLPSTSALLE